MHHVMFDIDGTLIDSFAFDEQCYMDAVHQVLGVRLHNNWSTYPHVTDSGILNQHLMVNDITDYNGEIHAKIKTHFLKNLASSLSNAPAKQIAGASDFISLLSQRQDVSLSIATGGLLESAMMKLQSAGIDVTGIPLASSNDHFSRTQIMRIALNKANVTPNEKLTYFGDASWDKRACQQLSFNFILVGNRIEHNQIIDDFTNTELAFNFIGLN